MNPENQKNDELNTISDAPDTEPNAESRELSDLELEDVAGGLNLEPPDFP